MILDEENGAIRSGIWVREEILYIVIFNEFYVRLM